MPEETERGKDIARDCFASLAKTKVRRTAIILFGSDSQLITSLRGAQRRGNLSGADKISLLTLCSVLSISAISLSIAQGGGDVTVL